MRGNRLGANRALLLRGDTVKRLWNVGVGTARDGETTIFWVAVDCYDPDVNADLKAELPGPPRWRGDKERWEFPLNWDSCLGARRVADKHGADLEMTSGLHYWAGIEKARRKTIPDVQTMELVDLPRVKAEAPTLWAAMQTRPFQTVGAAYAARNRSCLIADQPGLGKTLQAIGAVIESGVTGPILVVAPKAAAQLTWPQELARWAPGDKVIIIGDSMRPAERVDACEEAALWMMNDNQRLWVITSPYYLRIRAETDSYQNYVYEKGKKIIKPVGSALLGLFDIEWSAVIVDESHDTLAGATSNKKKQSAQRLGLGALTVKSDGLRIALSGTPFRGKESYLWGQLNWLRPDLFRAYWPWVEKYFPVDKGGFGWSIGKVADKAAIYADAKSVIIRRTKDEVASDLPPKTYPGWPLDSSPNSPVAVWLDMDGKQAKAYSGMVKNAAAELEDGTLLTNGILAELTRLKQFAGSYGALDEEGEFKPTLPSNKFDWLVEFLDERGINKASDVPMGERPKIVVVSQFASVLKAFEKGLEESGVKAWPFTGATSAKNREWIKADWQNNADSEFRILLLSTKAGGVSLTLDAADEMVILDETWNTSDQEQVEDRIHRLSRMHSVSIWKVFSRNTIEESIQRYNAGQEDSIKSIIDGERGVEFERVIKNLKGA